MENELHEGRFVWAKLPYGDFVIRDSGNVVLLAGGTGITAFIAFVESLTGDFKKKVFLAYGARKPELLLYKKSIDAKVGVNNGFRAFYFLESCGSTNGCGTANTRSTKFISGCLSLDSIWDQLDNPLGTKYYMAGPPAMIKTMTGKLLEKSIDAEMIKVDAWE